LKFRYSSLVRVHDWGAAITRKYGRSNLYGLASIHQLDIFGLSFK